VIRVRILTENRASEKGILAEHGLSMLVEVEGYKVLVDTGDTNVFASNARMLGEELSTVDALVLSHGHYDHTGGMPKFCTLNQKAKIYINPDAFCERYESEGGKPVGEHIGIPWSCEDKAAYMERIIFSKEPLNINENIILSGQVKVEDKSSKPSIYFVKKNENGECVDDPVEDEQFIIVKGKEGAYVFVGCSHPGILNCVSYAKKLVPNTKICGVVGGMHLGAYSTKQLDEIVAGLKQLEVEMVIPLHCTGIVASCHLKNSFGNNCWLLNCGDEIVLEK
jgi:7,8-dihydropterin-6-yl-methyl-4-(beta-D-ribofuranosyl)aminobenzene 5'-phosphate synthase